MLEMVGCEEERYVLERFLACSHSQTIERIYCRMLLVHDYCDARAKKRYRNSNDEDHDASFVVVHRYDTHAHDAYAGNECETVAMDHMHVPQTKICVVKSLTVLYHS